MIRDWIDRYKNTITAGGAFEYLKPIEDLNGRGDSLPLLSFYNAFPVLRNAQDTARGDIHRSGAREWDITGALQAGQLVVIARQDDAKLPMGLEIDGDPVDGGGIAIYQFVLPLTQLPRQPSIQSSTGATTQPQ